MKTFNVFNFFNIYIFCISLGISNSLDLTERQLSKIKFAQPPKAIVFPAYTSEILISILTSYLNDVERKSSIVDPKAIELCARKVASMTGDVRRALDIASQMITNIKLILLFKKN